MILEDEYFPELIEEDQGGKLRKKISPESKSDEDDLCEDCSECDLSIVEQTLEDDPIPEAAEPEQCKLESRLVQIQAEDYGGGIALPHYGYRRPSADYFNSNLMTYNFVIADISSGENNVFFYDERGQGKGADALCSLRIR